MTYFGTGNHASPRTTLSQVVNGVAPIDVALATNGGVASASSTRVYPGYSFPGLGGQRRRSRA